MHATGSAPRSFPTRRESLIYESGYDSQGLMGGRAHVPVSGIRAAMLHVRAKALADAESAMLVSPQHTSTGHNDGAGSVFEFTPREPEDACLEFVTRALRTWRRARPCWSYLYELYTDIGLVQALLSRMEV